MAAPKLSVSGLPQDITTDELKIVFGTYGSVVDVYLQGGGHAMVTYDSTKACEDAIQVLHNIYKIRTDAEYPIQVQYAAAGDMRGGGGFSDGGFGGGGGAPPPTGDQGGFGGGGGGRPDHTLTDTDHKLFIGGLPGDITEEEMNTVFGTYGEVAKVVLLKPNQNGNRAALVFYATRQSAEDAIKVLDKQYKIRHDAQEPIAVRWGFSRDDDKGKGKGGDGKGFGGRDMQAPHPNKVFAGNLPADLTEEELRTVFQTYGELDKVHLMAPHERNNKRAALIFYKERESADTAIKLLNEVYKFREDSEEPINVKWGRDRDDKGKGDGKDGGWGGQGGNWGNQGGGNWGNRGGDWQQKDNNWNGGGGDRWGGSGGGGGGDWNRGGGGGWQDRGRDNAGGGGWGGDRGGWDNGKGGGKGGKGGKGELQEGKLYVANLPEDITEDAISYVFGNYGKIVKVHIMNQKVMRGCVSAFVEYSSSQEADTAIATLDQKYEIRAGYGPLIVRTANARRSAPY